MSSGFSPASTCSAHTGDVLAPPKHSLNALVCITSSLVSTDLAAEPYTTLP